MSETAEKSAVNRTVTTGGTEPGMPAQPGYGGVFAWIAGYLLLVGAIQWCIPYPLDDDTAYHFSVARLIREQGVLHSFPWTRFSWQADHYADKEFFFHLLFVPFTQFGYNAASRIVGALGGASVLSAIFLVLRAERVRFAGLWALLPLGTAIFVYRFSQVRPHLFSISLAILLFWAYSRRRYLPLVTLALLYPLFYVAFWQIPLLLVLASETARFRASGRFDWRPPLAVLAGIAAGVALHPNAVNLLQMNWIHMTDILFRNAWGKHVEFNMGEEFEPLPPAEWLRYLPVTVMMVVAATVTAWRDRRRNFVATGSAVAVIIFFLLTLRTNRFLEYLVPFGVLSLALVLDGRRWKRWGLVSFAALSLGHTLIAGRPLLQYISSAEQRTWQMAEGVIDKFRQEIPPGANVFTCGWEYTGTLLVNLPDRNYLVALDPTLLYKRHPELYDLWYRTLKDAPPTSADIVRQSFASRYVVCLDHPTLHPFFDALAADGRTSVLHSDGKWVLIDLDHPGEGG